MSTVIVISEKHHHEELRQSIHQPSFEEFRRVGVTASFEPEERKGELKKILKQIKFLTGNCSRDVSASCRLSPRNYPSPYFLIIHSKDGVKIAKELSSELGHEQIADAIVIVPARELAVHPERRQDGILIATGPFEDRVIKRSIVEALVRFISQAPPVYLCLDVSSVFPRANEPSLLSAQA